jgi:hypothetical protein
MNITRQFISTSHKTFSTYHRTFFTKSGKMFPHDGEHFRKLVASNDVNTIKELIPEDYNEQRRMIDYVNYETYCYSDDFHGLSSDLKKAGFTKLAYTVAKFSSGNTYYEPLSYEDTYKLKKIIKNLPLHEEV